MRPRVRARGKRVVRESEREKGEGDIIIIIIIIIISASIILIIILSSIVSSIIRVTDEAQADVEALPVAPPALPTAP